MDIAVTKFYYVLLYVVRSCKITLNSHLTTLKSINSPYPLKTWTFRHVPFFQSNIDPRLFGAPSRNNNICIYMYILTYVYIYIYTYIYIWVIVAPTLTYITIKSPPFTFLVPRVFRYLVFPPFLPPPPSFSSTSPQHHTD